MSIREPAGPSLAQVLAVRGPLTPEEVVTLGVALARALADLHERSGVAGAVTATTVRFTSQGQPVLTTPPGGVGDDLDSTPAADLASLAALLRSLLPDRSPPVLRAVLDGAPAEFGSDGRVLARRLLAAWPAAPIQFTEGNGHSSRRHHRRGVVVATVLVTLTLLPVLGATALRGRPTSNGVTTLAPTPAAPPTPRLFPPTPTPDPPRTTTPADDWTAVVRDLDELRVAAFARLDAELLRRVYASRSPARASDLAALSALQRQGLHARGLRHLLDAVTPIRIRRGAAVLRVVDRRPAYDVLDARGEVVQHRQARGARTWRLVVHRVDGSWRIAAVRRG